MFQSSSSDSPVCSHLFCVSIISPVVIQCASRLPVNSPSVLRGVYIPVSQPPHPQSPPPSAKTVSHLFLKAEKCSFHQTSEQFLGYKISKHTIQMDKGKVEVVRNWPTTMKELQCFLSFFNFYWHFILNFSAITRSLILKQAQFYLPLRPSRNSRRHSPRPQQALRHRGWCLHHRG